MQVTVPSIDSKNDHRWRLVDAILRRLIFLIAQLGISPRELLERVRGVTEASGGLVGTQDASGQDTAMTNGRTYAEVHGGPAIIHNWCGELEFLDSQGRPRPLAIDGAGLSFSRLVRMSSPGVDQATALRELIAANAVRLSAEGQVELVNEFVIVSGAESRTAEMGLYAVDNLLASVQINVHAERGGRMFQREATCLHFDRRELRRVGSKLSLLCQGALASSDRLINQYAVPAGSHEDAVTVVVGTYITVRNPDAHS